MGEPGPIGYPGPRGEPGRDGKNGYNGSKGQKGNNTISLTVTSSSYNCDTISLFSKVRLVRQVIKILY